MSQKENIMEMAADVVAAYVSNNQLDPAQLPDLLQSVYTGMLKTITKVDEETVEVLVPAVPIEESVSNEYITCLEDGQNYKSLKRHLRSKFGLSPKAYREKWGLPTDYPMVAKNYSIERSRLAKRTGLGKS